MAILIVSTAAASLFARGLSANNAADMAVQLEPLFGSFSKYLLGTGLMAAGLSSAITAPLATAFAVTEVLGARDAQTKQIRFRIISMSVLLVGALLAISGVQPIKIILTAQFANGLLLPIVAIFLLHTMNNRAILGRHTNTLRANLLGFTVVAISLALGIRLILRAMGKV